MILIKNGTIIDGTGKKGYKADLLIKSGKVAAIGVFREKHAEITIDALGLSVAPGFIDVVTDVDHYLTIFTNPAQKDFLLQGVTTVIGGHCGSSLAPLLYGSLESIRKWANPDAINVNWHGMAEFLKVLEKRSAGVNFGTLAGHSTIRRALIGEDMRDLTVREIEVFKHLLRESLEEGALGLSTGLGYAHSRRVPYSEIKACLEPVKAVGGVYATHLRDERAGLETSMRETLRLARETGVPAIISHLRPLAGFEKQFRRALTMLAEEEGSAPVWFSSYPYDTSVVPIHTLLPEWAQNGGFEAMRAHLTEPEFKHRLARELGAARGEDIIIASIPGAAGFDHLIGKTLSAFAATRGLPVGEALVTLMIITGLRAVVFVKNVNRALAIESLMGARALVASNSAGLADDARMLKHERFTSTFPQFLERAFSAKMSREAALQKITSTPARLLGLKGRGIIAERAAADLVLFKEGTDGAVEIAHAFVSGAHAVKDGVATGALAGTILRRS